MIRTGAHASRIVDAFRPALGASVSAVRDADPAVSVYVYGSVANGQAVEGRSDVDVLTVGLDDERAVGLATRLSAEFTALCRGVEIAPAHVSDLDGDGDEAYGFWVFLRHYCVHLAGSDVRPEHDFPADSRAARGFNGDIGRHRDRWVHALAAGDDPARLASVVARKTLLAVAGLVSVHDDTWTTDRTAAARRWGEIEPGRRVGLATLEGWVDTAEGTSPADMEAVLESIVDPVVARFETTIGLWPS